MSQHGGYVGDENEYVGYDDEVGGELDIVGGGELDIVGAPPARNMQRQGQRQGQRPAPRLPGMPQGARVMSDKPSAARRQVSPVPLTTIPAGATADIEFRPQRPIRMERLILDCATPGGVFLVGLEIGAEPQFVNGGAVPISVFGPTAIDTGLQGNTATPGISISLRVLNSTGAAVVLGGAVLGTTLT